MRPCGRITMSRIFVRIAQPGAGQANAGARERDQQQFGVHQAASSLGGRALALVAQSLAALVGALGEAGFHLQSLLASGLWSHLLSTL